jgi:hypothetical protein
MAIKMILSEQKWARQMTSEASIVDKANRLIAASDADLRDRRRIVGEFETAILHCAEPAAMQALADLSPLFPKLNRIYESFETDLEIEFAKTLLSFDVDVRQYSFYQRFVTLVSNEVRFAGLKEGDCVTFVGSGPFPISAILLFQTFGIRAIAVERKDGAAGLSREVVKRLGLEKGIDVRVGEGQHLAINDSCCAIIALLAQPKGAILHHVFEHYARCTSVLCRTSHGLRQALYRPTDPFSLAPYKIFGTHLATGDQTISSILLRRWSIAQDGPGLAKTGTLK